MKRKLLSVAILAMGLSANAQVLFQDNFETYNVGNTAAITTNLQQYTLGFPDKWITYCAAASTNSDLSDFSIMQDLTGKVMNIKSGIGGAGTPTGMGRLTIPINDIDWENRTLGNNVLELSFSFFTGPTNSQASAVQIDLASITSIPTVSNGQTTNVYPTLVGLHYEIGTRQLSPLMYYTGQGSTNNYYLTLQEGGNPVLPANTWVNVKANYNKTTGQSSFLMPEITNIVTIQNAATGHDFDDTPFISHYSKETVTTKQDFKIDNIVIKATNSTNLSTESNELTIGEIKVYPNPANDVINVSSTQGAIEHYAIVDLTGKTVKFGEVSSLENLSVNIQDLASGAYIMNIKTDKAIKNLKFVKK